MSVCERYFKLCVTCSVECFRLELLPTQAAPFLLIIFRSSSAVVSDIEVQPDVAVSDTPPAAASL